MKKLFLLWLFGFFLVFHPTLTFAKTFEGIDYTVIEKTNIESIKCSIVVRLERKVSKDFLQKLALKLRQEEHKKYDRMFITYVLPNTVPNVGAWATSHFDPNLEVKILGITLEEEKTLKNNPKDYSTEIIGEWLDDSAYGAKYTLLKRKSKIFMIQKYTDGSSSENEMIQKKQSGKLRFDEKISNGFGEYYLIDSDGRLGLYDNAGLFNKMRPINTTPTFYSLL